MISFNFTAHMHKLLIFIIAIFLISCSSKTDIESKTVTENLSIQPSDGYYLPKEYLNYNFNEDAINAVGLSVSKTDSILNIVSFNCQECMAMGDNFTTSTLLTKDAFELKWSVSEINNQTILISKSDNGKVIDTLYWISKEKFKALNDCQFGYIEKELNKYNTVLFNKNGKLEFNIGNCFPSGCSSNVFLSMEFKNNTAKIKYLLEDEEYNADGKIFLNSHGEEMIVLNNIFHSTTNKPKENKIAIVKKDVSDPKKITIFILDNTSVEKVENEMDNNFDNYTGVYFQNYNE